MLLADLAYSHINDQLSTLSIERSTADDYTKAIRAWVRSIGNLPMESVTEDVLRDGMRDMLSKGITPRTLSKRYTILKTILDAAERRGRIAENPLRWIKKPRVDETERNYLPKDERERLKKRLADMKPSAYVLADMLALYAGLRCEEVCALQVRDIDLTSRMGYVRRAIGRDGWRTYEKGTKGRKTRDFPLSEKLAAYLETWLNFPPAMKPRKDAYLLTLSEDWLHPSKVGRMWSKLAEVDDIIGANGKRPTFHDLRHTFATACVAGGMDVKTLQSILGHTDARVTLNVYASADRDAKIAAAKVIDQAV